MSAAQITALRARGDDVIVGTSNLGRVYRLRDTYRSRGEYVSQVKDTATTSRWGRLRWRGEFPEGTSVRMFTRSGNTADADETWSDWSEPYSDPTGSSIGSPPARFIQWKAQLAADDVADTPVLQWVELVYVQRNLRPEIDEFTVHPAGVIYRRNTSPMELIDEYDTAAHDANHALFLAGIDFAARKEPDADNFVVEALLMPNVVPETNLTRVSGLSS